MRDLDFVSGKFFEYEIPKDKQYLLKYFATELQEAFLRYMFVFGEWSCFREHTGFRARLDFLKKLEFKFVKLQEVHKKATLEFDLDLKWKIESGNYHI